MPPRTSPPSSDTISRGTPVRSSASSRACFTLSQDLQPRSLGGVADVVLDLRLRIERSPDHQPTLRAGFVVPLLPDPNRGEVERQRSFGPLRNQECPPGLGGQARRNLLHRNRRAGCRSGGSPAASTVSRHRQSRVGRPHVGGNRDFDHVVLTQRLQLVEELTVPPVELVAMTQSTRTVSRTPTPRIRSAAI